MRCLLSTASEPHRLPTCLKMGKSTKAVKLEIDQASVENRQHFPTVRPLPQLPQTLTAPAPSLFITVCLLGRSYCVVLL